MRSAHTNIYSGQHSSSLPTYTFICTAPPLHQNHETIPDSRERPRHWWWRWRSMSRATVFAWLYNPTGWKSCFWESVLHLMSRCIVEQKLKHHKSSKSPGRTKELHLVAMCVWTSILTTLTLIFLSDLILCICSYSFTTVCPLCLFLKECERLKCTQILSPKFESDMVF